MKKVLFFCAFLLVTQSYSQSNWKEFKKLSCPIKKWVLTHIFKAHKVKSISLDAKRVSDSIAKTPLLDGDPSGGQVDAFRHTGWQH